MACSCGKNKAGGVKKYVHTYTTTSGAKTSDTYDKEMEARQAASRLGGTVRPI